MSSQLKEGILHTLFFITAIGLLLYNTFGILTIPGLIAAVICAVFALKQNYYIPAVIGIVVASGSLFAQYMTAYCPYCTMAAFCFFIGGILSLRHVFTKMLPVSIGLVVIISVGLTLFTAAPVIDTRAAESNTNVVLPENLPKDKPLLFISTSCRACEETVALFIENDPYGKTWRPVIVPDLDKETGENLLAEKGYKGETLSALDPPGKRVPALLDEETLYEGTKTIENYLLSKEDANGSD